MNHNILITSAGRRVSLVNMFKIELRKLAPGSQVFACDSNMNLCAAAMVADDCFKVPKVSEQNYFKRLLALCKANKIKLVIPTLDIELIPFAAQKSRFEKHGITILVSDQDLAEIFDSKCLTSKYMKKFGIQSPAIYTKKDYKLPIFIKPINGSASKENHLVRTEDELCPYYFKNEKLGFFEYIDPKEFKEYTCDLLYSNKGELKCVVPRLRLEIRSGESSKGVTEKNVLFHMIKEKLMVVKGLRGCITIQFFVSRTNPEDVRLIEVNPRFGGAYPLSYFAGANFPKWIIEEFILGKPVDYFEDWEQNLLMLRYDEEILVHEYKG